MYLITLFFTAILSLFSTGVMCYISMATPIGPWIAPTLVLICILFFKLCMPKGSYTRQIALATAGGSVGGILATAMGFYFPTLFFLNASLFNEIVSRPLYFSALVSWLALSAGWFGFVIANILEDSFIHQQRMPFPVGQLVHKMIAVQNQARKAWELVAGFFGTIVFCTLQMGIASFKALIPRAYILIEKTAASFFVIPKIVIRFDQLPMLWAIGFITGHVIAKPLAVGMVSKIFFIDPINNYFFKSISSYDFLMAFCSGMVLSGAISSFIRLPKMVKNAVETVKNGNKKSEVIKNAYHAVTVPELLILSCVLFGFLFFTHFSILGQLFLLVGTFICSYQIVAIAGKIGLATLGRFATFVMVPFMLIFGANSVHITIVATFVGVCGGVATDILFGRKMGQLSKIAKKELKIMQFFGLLISAFSIGFFMWLLINHFGLGTEELIAQRAQARAMLVTFTNFNGLVLLIGALFGYTLKFFKINPMLVLGGLLMSPSYVLVLVAGGLSTLLVKDREEWDPFWSGVFAANSMWVLVQAIFSSL